MMMIRDKAIPSGLLFKRPEAEMLKRVLTRIMETMENPDEVKVNDDKLIVKILSHIKSEGCLL